MEDWLKACPESVVSHVVKDVSDIKHLAASSFLYGPNTLIVVPLSSLSKLIYD